MTYLISGSIVTDNILIHNGKFKNSILPEKLDNLNVSFDLSEIHQERGGTGGNILYNAQILATKMSNIPHIITHVGSDFESNFSNHFGGVNAEHLKYLKIDQTRKGASSFILNAADGNQITSFYQGVMTNELVEQDVPLDKFDHFLLSPENPKNTIFIANLCMMSNKKFYFDPGQCTPIFTEHHNKELNNILLNTHGLFVNEYEASLLEGFLGDELKTLFNYNKNLHFIVLTKGSKGFTCFERDKVLVGPCFKTDKVVDATGCGDAFRAGFFYAYLDGNYNPFYGCLYGSVMASFSIESLGGQNHKPTRQDLGTRQQNYMQQIYSQPNSMFTSNVHNR